MGFCARKSENKTTIYEVGIHESVKRPSVLVFLAVSRARGKFNTAAK